MGKEATQFKKGHPHRFKKGNTEWKKARTHRAKFSEQFIVDFMTWWEKQYRNQKGLDVRDPLTGKTLRLTNGQQLLRVVSEKYPERVLALATQVFGYITPKEIKTDVGDNLLEYLEGLDERDRFINAKPVNGRRKAITLEDPTE